FKAHRREPTRLSTLAETWGLSPTSSALQQTVGALKQFGLVDDEGAGFDRKVQISELGRRIIADQRPGVRQSSLKEAARNPVLIAEYLDRWLPTRPSDTHCTSELIFDRGFNLQAARLFLRVFDQTVEFAGFRGPEGERAGDDTPDSVSMLSDGPVMLHSASQGTPQHAPLPIASSSSPPWHAPLPVAFSSSPRADSTLAERLQVVSTGDHIRVTALLYNASEIEKLIRILRANQAILDEDLA
ncbi:MAG TPA: hypothetical protein VGB65_11685, partial [Allosphingosinicella sp.]